VFAGTGAAGPPSSSPVKATAATLNSPIGVAVDPSGDVFIADDGNHVVRKVDPGGTISTFAGNGTLNGGGSPNGTATGFALGEISDLITDASGNVVIVGDFNTQGGGNSVTVFRVTPAGQSSQVGNLLAATSTAFHALDVSIVLSGSDSAYWIDGPINAVLKKRTFGSAGMNDFVVGSQGGNAPGVGDNGPGGSAGLSSPHSLRADDAGVLYIADTGDNKIRRYDPTADRITSVVGTGAAGNTGGNGQPGTSTQVSAPSAIAISNGILTIADAGNGRILQMGLG
jgi:hypothetical protein